MIRLDQIKEVFRTLVGWERYFALADAIDWSEFEDSESNLLYNDAHPLLTPQNIASIMPEDFYYRYSTYNDGTSYPVGTRVRVGKTIYYAVTQTTGAPTEEASGWAEFPAIYDYQLYQVDKGTTQVIQRFLTEKQINKENKPLLERRTFFDGAGRLNATVENRSKLVGFEIVPVRSMGVTTKIERIGFQGSGATGTITIYIFHTSQVNPLYTLEFSYTNTYGGVQWFTPSTDVYLPYISDTTDAGGAWLLCYNQDDLPDGLEAINVSKDWSRDPCGTCNVGSLQTWREITKYIQISPFCYDAPSTFATYPECPDIEYLAYTNTSNYGLNVEISVECDLTDFIISQRLMFANVLQKQVAYNVLRTMAMNPDVRVNRNQSNVGRMEILYELDGNTQGRKTGLGVDLDKAYKAIDLDTKGIDRICLACNNHGVRYRTV